MNKDENLEWEKGENCEISVQNTKQSSGVKSKNKTSKALKDSTKRIEDYFQAVPKANVERTEDSGVALKDESRVTEHTTPDKSVAENVKCQANEVSKGKQGSLKRCFSFITHILDICIWPHC